MPKAKTIKMRDKRGNIATPLAADAEIWRAAGWSDVLPDKPRAKGDDDQDAHKPVMTKDHPND